MNRFEDFDKIKNRYVKQGLLYFVVGFALLLSYFAISHFSVVKAGLHRMNDILMPFYLGIVMAYIMTPVFNWCTKTFYKWLKGKRKTAMKDLKLAKVFSTLICLILLLGIIFGLIVAVVPGTIESVMTLLPRIEPALDSAAEYLEQKMSNNPALMEYTQIGMDNLGESIINLAKNKLLPATETIMTSVYAIAAGTVGAVIDFLIAIILFVYILNNKEAFSAQGRKWVLSIARPEKAEDWFELASMSDETFGGFINGKIIDSIIMGILCAICMKILNIPLVALISVIVGLTNIIPFFGPFIGAIPSIILLLIVDPIKALEFAVLILALQQFDGNIMGPKILGKALNLSAFWVMFAIIVAGGLFGFLGMILGVPVFAILYTYISRGINKGLKEKNYGTDQRLYEDFHKYGIEKSELYGEEAAAGETGAAVDIGDNTAKKPKRI